MTIEQKISLVQEYQEAKKGGWSIKRWCKTNDIACSTFYRYRREVKELSATDGKAPVMDKDNNNNGMNRSVQWIAIPTSRTATEEKAHPEKQPIIVTCGNFRIRIENGADVKSLADILTAVNKACS